MLVVHSSDSDVYKTKDCFVLIECAFLQLNLKNQLSCSSSDQVSQELLFVVGFGFVLNLDYTICAFKSHFLYACNRD